MALDPHTGRPWLGAGTGGVSGPAVRAIALAQVHAVAGAVEIPLIGMGGVQSGEHARDLLRAGATLVAVGTESFRDPAAGRAVRDGLRAFSQTLGQPAERLSAPPLGTSPTGRPGARPWIGPSASLTK
jgi:dihydroorotate dehydrogenase (NAD+) catalytic subunit